MTKYLFLFFFAFSLNIVSCQNGKSTVISADDFAQKIKSTPNAQIIDVRTPEEFNGGHIDQATNMNFFDPNFNTQVLTLKKDQPVFVYCQMGGRSAKAAAKLKELGFNEVYDLKGGYSNWPKK